MAQYGKSLVAVVCMAWPTMCRTGGQFGQPVTRERTAKGNQVFHIDSCAILTMFIDPPYGHVFVFSVQKEAH